MFWHILRVNILLIVDGIRIFLSTLAKKITFFLVE